MPFMDLIKKAIFEEEPQTAKQPGKPAGGPAAARPMDPAPSPYVPMGTRDNQFYARLAKQTDLSAVPDFDSLLTVLNSSATMFNKQTDDVSRTEIDAKIAQISDINESIQQKQKEIADLQQQVKSMQSQTEVSRAKLQEAKNNFAAALERRRAEIQQQRKEIETILG